MRDHLLNLQLFTDGEVNPNPNPNVQTTLLTGEGNSLAAEMKVFYNKTLIDYAEPALVHDQFADKYNIPANGGKTIEFRKYDSLDKALTPLEEGVTPDGDSLNVTTIQATVDQYGNYITVSDMLKMTAIDNNIVQSLKLLGSQAGRTMDTITRDVLAGGTNVIRVGARESRKDLTSEDTLKPLNFFQAAAQLEAMNAPKIDGSYVAIIHPYAAFDVMTSEGWVDAVKYSSATQIFEGEIGKIGNVRFVQSSEAKIWKDETCPTGLAVFGTIVVGANAYATTEVEGGGLETIVKQLGAGDDPLNQRATVGWKGTKVSERLVEQYMVRIESTSAYSGTVKAN